MIEEEGIVVALDRDGAAWVETARASTCAGCSVAKGCGSGVLAQFLGRGRHAVRARNAAAAGIGDRVVVAVAEHALLRGSVAVYLIPLLAMLGGAMLGESLRAGASGDGPAMLWGALGLTVGLAWLWLFGRWAARDERYQPIVIRTLAKLSGSAEAAVAGEVR